MSFILKISFRLLLKIIIKKKNNSQNVREGGWVFREEEKGFAMHSICLNMLQLFYSFQD